jgi:hypothetical protein
MGNEPLPFGASLIQNSPTLGATPAKSIGFQQKTLRAKLTSDDKSAGPGFFTRPMRGQAGKPNVARSRRSSGTPSRPCTTPCPCSSSEESAPDARLLAPYACHNALPAACTEDAQAHWQTSLRLFGAIFCCVLAALRLMNSRRDADHAGAEHDGRCHCLCLAGSASLKGVRAAQPPRRAPDRR